jgi:hypothetical protein
MCHRYSHRWRRRNHAPVWLCQCSLRYFSQFIIIQTFIHCIITWIIISEDITMKKHSSTRSS